MIDYETFMKVKLPPPEGVACYFGPSKVPCYKLFE